MNHEQQQMVNALTEELISLRRRIEGSFVNETALIATLEELVPGFSLRFDQLRIGIEKTFAENDPKLVEKLKAAMKYRVQ